MGPRRLAVAVPNNGWDRCGFIPAFRRWHFFAEILLHLFVDKAVPEILLLDCAAEPAPRGRDVRRRHRGYNAGPSPGCLGQSQNWRLSLLLLLLLQLLLLQLLLLLVQMLLLVRRASPTRLDARVAGAAGGVVGGSDRGSMVEVVAGGSGGPLSLFNGRVRGLGGQPGGRGFNQETEDRGPSRGRARRRHAR